MYERAKDRVSKLEKQKPRRGKDPSIKLYSNPDAEELWNAFWAEKEAAKAISKETEEPYFKALGDLLSLCSSLDSKMIVEEDAEGVRIFSLDNVKALFENVERSFTKSYRYKDLTRPVLD